MNEHSDKSDDAQSNCPSFTSKVNKGDANRGIPKIQVFGFDEPADHFEVLSEAN